MRRQDKQDKLTRADRAKAEQVAARLEGKESRHEKAERRRASICRSFHYLKAIGRSQKLAYEDLAHDWCISPSTVRSIHTQYCRITGTKTKRLK